MTKTAVKKQKYKEAIHTILRIWSYAGKKSVPFFLCVLIGASMPLYETVLVGETVYKFTYACTIKSLVYLKQTVVLMLLMFTGYLVYTFCYAYVYTNFVRIAIDIKKSMFHHVLQLPMGFFSSNNSGDISTRMISDYNKAVELIGYPMLGQFNPISLLVSIIVVSILVIKCNVLLGILSISVSLLNMIFINSLSLKLQSQEISIKKVISASTQEVIDALSGIVVSRMFGLEGYLQNKYNAETEDIFNQGQTLNKKKSVISMLIDFQQFLSFTGVIGIGLVLSAKGYITLANIMYISSMQTFLSNYVAQFSQKFSQMQSYIVGAQRIFELMDSPKEVMREDKASPETGAKTAIEVKELNFRYPGKDRYLFEHFHMKIKTGEHVAIVGNSGEGKSTLIKLLLEFDDRESGDVMLFGNSSTDYSRASVRDLCAYVPQKTYLYHATIRENILLDGEGTEDEIWNALKMANLKDFVSSLPEGLNTIIGEGGAGLSGGQGQKIAIARALFEKKPIILMDEATSSLDVNSEKDIQSAFDHLAEGRTCIVIAHRLSTIKNMDRILVLKSGEVVEEGSNDELMKLGGIYSELYNKQYKSNDEKRQEYE